MVKGLNIPILEERHTGGLDVVLDARLRSLVHLTQLMHLVVFLVDERVNGVLLGARLLVVVDMVQGVEVLVQQGLHFYVHLLRSSTHIHLKLLSYYRY